MLLLILLILLVAIGVSCLRIVPEATCYVIEFLGSYKTTWGNGIHFKIPVLERVARRVSLKEQMSDFPPQGVITKDNVSMNIDSVVFFRIIDAKLFTYGAENPIRSLGNISATTLRNIIGSMDLDDTLSSRDKINTEMQIALDEATDPWGIKVTKVEIKDIVPPPEIQKAMEKQMKAERDRRETQLEAEGHKQAVVTREEGNKKAQILKAEAESEAEIKIAQGKAESIRLMYEAEARGIQMLKEAGVDERIITLKKLDALKALGDGRATKIIVPTELASSASNLGFVSEMLGTPMSEPFDKSEKVVPKVEEVDICCTEEDDLVNAIFEE